MQQFIIAALIGTASLGASAAGFSPWADAARTTSEPVQERVEVPPAGPFYRIDAPRADTPDARQIQIRITPWYLDGGA